MLNFSAMTVTNVIRDLGNSSTYVILKTKYHIFTDMCAYYGKTFGCFFLWSRLCSSDEFTFAEKQI